MPASLSFAFRNSLGILISDFVISAPVLATALTFSTAAPQSSAGELSGFALPQPGKAFRFPRDHGSHPEFRIEWWYVTGHLFAKDNRRFGFQATFFRRSGPFPGKPAAPSSFGTDQFFLGHMALLDVASGTFLHQERLNRSGWDAAASTETLDLRNGNWTLRFDPAAKTPDAMLLTGTIRGDAALTLTLAPQKPLVIFGEDGVSRKGSDPSAASHYLTWPRLAVTGTVRTGADTRDVTGSAWMDHEISSSQLTDDQAGWDWACLQLDDGREVMAYRMRRRDGSTDPFSTLAWIDRDGRINQIKPPAFRWESTATWTSPESKATYPTRVRLTAPDPATGTDTAFSLEPLAEAQELTGTLGGVTYWEGACRVRNAAGTECGRAFLELTGYAGDLSRQLGR